MSTTKVRGSSPAVPYSIFGPSQASNMRRSQIRGMLKRVQAVSSVPRTPSLARSLRSRVERSETTVEELLDGSEDIREEMIAEYRPS